MKLKLVKIAKEAKGTKSFYFEPEKTIDYLPGQYFYFNLPKLTHKDSRGATRMFTLSLSPTEGELLRFTTRIRESSGFKHTLEDFKVGTEITGEGPEGSYVFDDRDLPAQAGKGEHVFIAGGIGITPFRSMIKFAMDKKMGTKLHLIYSNSIPEEITFRAELEKWAKESNKFKLDMTITKPEESKAPWSGLTGRIDDSMLNKLIKDIHKPTFWVVGPPTFVEAMEKVLKNLKIPSGQIRTEKFSGY